MNTGDSIDYIVQLGLVNLKERGVFWYAMPRPMHFTVRDALQKLLEKKILVLEPEPWDEFVFLETAKCGSLDWLTPHAQLRYDMRINQGIPEVEVPVLPKGINSLEELLPDEDD